MAASDRGVTFGQTIKVKAHLRGGSTNRVVSIFSHARRRSQATAEEGDRQRRRRPGREDETKSEHVISRGVQPAKQRGSPTPVIRSRSPSPDGGAERRSVATRPPAGTGCITTARSCRGTSTVCPAAVFTLRRTTPASASLPRSLLQGRKVRHGSRGDTGSTRRVRSPCTSSTAARKSSVSRSTSDSRSPAIAITRGPPRR